MHPLTRVGGSSTPRPRRDPPRHCEDTAQYGACRDAAPSPILLGLSPTPHTGLRPRLAGPYAGGHTHKTLPTPPSLSPCCSLFWESSKRGGEKNSNFWKIIDLQGLGTAYGVGRGGCRQKPCSFPGALGTKPPSQPPWRRRPCATPPPPALYLKKQVAMTTQSGSRQPLVPQEGCRKCRGPRSPPPSLASLSRGKFGINTPKLPQ